MRRNRSLLLAQIGASTLHQGAHWTCLEPVGLHRHWLVLRQPEHLPPGSFHRLLDRIGRRNIGSLGAELVAGQAPAVHLLGRRGSNHQQHALQASCNASLTCTSWYKHKQLTLPLRRRGSSASCTTADGTMYRGSLALQAASTASCSADSGVT